MSWSSHHTGSNFNKNFALHNDLTLQARAIRVINVFRFILSIIFVVFYTYADKFHLLSNENPSLFFSLALAYLLFSISLLIITPVKSPTLLFFHPIQIVIDILFIIMLMHAAGGIQSGLGLLLIITIVTASLVSDGRLALFYAAIATIGLLLQESYQIAQLGLEAASYTQSVMLSLSCFATAWLAYSLAERILQTEALASSRGVDLANLAQVNELITQEMDDGVIVVDEFMHIRHHNFQAEMLLGLNAAHPSARLLESAAPDIAARLTAWKNNQDNPNGKETIISIKGKELHLRFEPINRTQRSLGAVIFIQDWSKIQSAAQQAKLAALGRLTANIAHEIRNPLSAISHANQLLQEEPQTEPNTRILQIIADNTQRINQIIKDVLELNRRDRTVQEKIPVQEFIQDFHAQFCAIERIPPTHFLLEFMTAQHTIAFDRGHLSQILWNLCKNGWEHSQKKMGSLKLVLTENLNGMPHLSPKLQFEIIDDGAGIPESERSKLFEPFHTTKTTGNGLGLYISRELAEANNAHVAYLPQKQGSAFVLQLKYTN